MTKVSDVDLHEKLKQFFGFDYFKGDQEAVIKSVLAGRNSFVIMPTGGGKSMCYQLPALVMEGTAIVVSPLISLMKNQVDALRSHATEHSIAHVYNSSLSKAEQLAVKEDLLAGKIKLLYMAPESLVKAENMEMLKQVKISFIAIDEAHCISEWGHDFRPEYGKIRQIVNQLDKKMPIMALTATATQKVRHDIQKNLNILDADIYQSSFNRPNMYYEIREKTSDVNKEVVKFIKKNEGKSGIIYCLSRKQVEDLAEFLRANDIKALAYHAGLDATLRAETQDKFLMEEIDVIVATIAFGMGIDKPDVRYVIHYDMPKSLEGYYQETGRAGRDGGEALCIAFYAASDLRKIEKLSKNKPSYDQEIAKNLLLETEEYAVSLLCRRRHLLHYFGERYDKENCENCDNCLMNRPKEDGQDYFVTLLTAVKETKQQFQKKYLINVLLGIDDTQEIKRNKHDKLKSYCAGQDKSERFWSSLIWHALFEKLLDKNLENYGVLKLTKEGEKYLKKPYPIMVVKEEPIEKEEDEDIDDDYDDDMPMTQKGGCIESNLLAMLKDELKSTAKRENLPPYVIFQQTSLEDMCNKMPTTMAELVQIQGVGEGKAKKYGQPFLNLIKRYVEDNDITPPQELTVKSTLDKSELKVFIIGNIDNKIDLEDIARAKNIDMDELLTQIEHIVNSGTKINIDYYIQDTINEDTQEEIMEYLRESEEDSVEKAWRDLGENDYDLDDIRLMRIKLLSQGN